MIVERSNRCVSCCPFPWISLPIALETIAVVCFGVAAFSCRTFVHSYTDDIAGVTDDVEFGYWKIVIDTGGCLAYDALFDFDDDDDYDDDFNLDEVRDEFLDQVNDPAFLAGKSIGIIGIVLGGLHVLFLLTFTFIAFPRYKLALSLSSGLCFFLACCSGLLLVGLGNDNFCDYDNDTDPGLGDGKCRPSSAGYCVVLAFVFFVAAGVVMILFARGVWCGGFEPRTNAQHAQASIESKGPEQCNEKPGNNGDIGSGTSKTTATKKALQSEGTIEA